MNLYDRDDGFRNFSLEQANALLPRIIAITEGAVELLRTLREEFEAAGMGASTIAQSEFDETCGHILANWSREVADLGVYPKGYFTVDFKSPVPDTLLCWTFGEHMVSHSHKIYESFKDRIPVTEMPDLGFEKSLN